MDTDLTKKNCIAPWTILNAVFYRKPANATTEICMQFHLQTELTWSERKDSAEDRTAAVNSARVVYDKHVAISW